MDSKPEQRMDVMGAGTGAGTGGSGGRRRTPWLEGAFVALVTPFRGDGGREVDEEGLRGLVRWHLEAGTDGLVPCGTTGEAATMSAEEFARVVGIVREEVDRAGRGLAGTDAGTDAGAGTGGSGGAVGRRPVLVVAGTGSNATRGSIERTRLAKEVGADAALVVTPYYNKPTQEGLYQHYAAVVQEGGLPVVVYNVPGRTAGNILPETVARLARDFEGIVAVKEASGNLGQVSELIGRLGQEVAVLSGDDGLNFPIAALGGAGGISVLGNVMPGETARLFRAVRDGDLETARALHHRVHALIKALFVETNPLPVKTALAMMGRLQEAVFRLPLCEMSAGGQEVLRGALADMGLV